MPPQGDAREAYCAGADGRAPSPRTGWGVSFMRKWLTAALAAAFTVQFAAPVLARDMFAPDVFNPTTMLGWRHQTGPGVVAYFRAPLGPDVLTKNTMRAGLAVMGPRAYAAGRAPLHSQGPRLLDFSVAARGADAGWVPSLNVGRAVAWTSDPDSLKPGQINLMDSGLSWVAVGAVTVGLAVGIFAVIEDDDEDAAQ